MPYYEDKINAARGQEVGRVSSFPGRPDALLKADFHAVHIPRSTAARVFWTLARQSSVIEEVARVCMRQAR